MSEMEHKLTLEHKLALRVAALRFALTQAEKVLSDLQRGAMPPSSFAHLLGLIRKTLRETA